MCRKFQCYHFATKEASLVISELINKQLHLLFIKNPKNVKSKKNVRKHRQNS